MEFGLPKRGVLKIVVESPSVTTCRITYERRRDTILRQGGSVCQAIGDGRDDVVIEGESDEGRGSLFRHLFLIAIQRLFLGSGIRAEEEIV